MTNIETSKMCESPLHADEIYNIMFFFPTEDVLRCMQVCKYWKKILLEQNFWRKYVSKHFDLELVTDREELEGEALSDWADETEWFCYYKDESDPYVVRPFPSMLKCGVIIPFGLDLLSFDTKHLQGLSRLLEILTYMREGVKKLELMCGNECSSNEDYDELSMVLIPWDGVKLPTEEEVFTNIFHFHPEILENMTVNTSVSKEKLYFHIFSDQDRESVGEQCLHSVFGKSGTASTTDEANFFAWLQKIMVPTCNYITGYQNINPAVHFFITTLAPGWVGGVLTGQTWT